MTEVICTPWEDPKEGFSTEYSIYGEFDVDQLLAKARPKGAFSVWRTGETTDIGVASSSGVTIPVSDGASRAALFRDVGEFLDRDRELLLEARHVTGVQRGLLTSITLNAGEIPVGLELPAALLFAAGQLDVSWAVMAFPYWDADAAQQ
jgi:hypothetical protein